MQNYQTPEEKKTYKEQKKAIKKRIVSEHGYLYYLRDKTWFNIKDQRPGEDYEAWKKRLAFYGFTTEGVDSKNDKKHNAVPMVNF